MKTQISKAQKMRAKDAKVHDRQNIFIWQQCFLCVCVSLCKRVSTLNRDLLSLTVKMYEKWRKFYKKSVIDSDDSRFTALYFGQFLF